MASLLTKESTENNNTSLLNGDTLLTLPVELLAIIISFITNDKKEIFRISLVNKILFNSLFNSEDIGADEIWRSLTKETFRVTQEKFNHFPKIKSHKTLYSILEQYVPKEGFYVLSEMHPWGILFLFHFVKGQFVGELMIPTNVMNVQPEYEKQAYILKPIFACDFTEDTLLAGKLLGSSDKNNTLLSSSSGSSGKLFDRKNDFNVEILELDKLNMDIVVRPLMGNAPNALFTDVHLKNKGHCIRIVPLVSSNSSTTTKKKEEDEEGTDDDDINNSSTANSIFSRFSNSIRIFSARNFSRDGSSDSTKRMLLSNYGLPESSEAISAREILTRIFSQSPRFPISEKMVKSVFDLYKVKLMEEAKEESSVKNPNNLGLTFTYVDGPTRKLDLKYQKGMLRPGLYTGFYHPEMYGKFCKECVLIEYKKYTFDGKNNEKKQMNDLITWKIIQDEIFNSSAKFQQSDPSNIFDNLQKQVSNSQITEVVFLTARKVTGDIHVPAGVITFASLIYPEIESISDKDSTTTKKGADKYNMQDTFVYDRDNANTKYKLLKKYRGWGTVSYPGFRNPSWLKGHFLQVEPDSSGGDRFGFHWGDMDDDDGRDETTILNWVTLQNDFPWFNI